MPQPTTMRGYASHVVRGAAGSKIPTPNATTSNRPARSKLPKSSNGQQIKKGKFIEASASCEGCQNRCDELEEMIENLRDECSLALQILQERMEKKMLSSTSQEQKCESKHDQDEEQQEEKNDNDDTVIHVQENAPTWKPAVQDLEMRVDLVLTKFQDKLQNLQLHQDTIQTRQNTIQETHDELKDDFSEIKCEYSSIKQKVSNQENNPLSANSQAALPPRPRCSPTVSVARSTVSQAISETQEEILSKLTNCVRNLSDKVEVLRQNGDQRTNFLSGEFGVLSSRVTKLTAQLNVLQPAFEVYKRLQPQAAQSLSWPAPGDATTVNPNDKEPGNLNATSSSPLVPESVQQNQKIEKLEREVDNLKTICETQSNQISQLLDKRENVNEEGTEKCSVIEKIEESNFSTKLRDDPFIMEDTIRELRDGITNVAEQQVATVKSVKSTVADLHARVERYVRHHKRLEDIVEECRERILVLEARTESDYRMADEVAHTKKRVESAMRLMMQSELQSTPVRSLRH